MTLTVGIRNATDKGLRSINQRFKQFGNRLEKDAAGPLGRIGAGLAKFGPQIGAGLAAAGATVVAFGAKTLESADRVGKLATQTGISVEGIQRLSHAAELGGTDIESLAKAQGRLTRVVSDAANGLESAARPLRQVGLEYEELAKDVAGAAVPRGR